MNRVKLLISSSVLCVATAALFVGCETTQPRVEAEVTVDKDGNPVFRARVIWGGGTQPVDGDSDNRLLDPSQDPPIGLQHIGTAIEGKGIVDVFMDPNTGVQWVQVKSGDYYPIYWGGYEIGSDGTAIQDAGSLNINPVHLFDYSTSIGFSFDESTDAAMMEFVFPEVLTDDYMAAANMPFLVQEDRVILPNGDYLMTYTGSINDVLGAAWSLGILEIKFKDPLAGFVDVILAGNSNIVTINTSIESRTIVLEFTAPNNLP